MLGMYAFTLDDNAEDDMDMLKLSNYLRTNVKDELIRIPGLSQVDIMGTSQYAMRIWLDTTRMSSLGIDTSEIAAAIGDQNIAATAGSVGSENSNNYLQYKVNAVGRLQTVEEFENIVVRSTADGRIIKLKDIATVELASEDYSTYATYNDRPVLMVIIYRNASANAITVVDSANAKLQELQKFFPKGVEYHMGYDTTEYIRTTMEEIIVTLILTLVLVVLITYLFLQNWRATLIPSLTIPVSIMGTFVFLYIMGYSLNLLTMFALILVIGSLVDDAIVVVENVIRLMDDEKLSPKEATIKSIYVPIGFYGGMVGKIYLQFSVTMCIALVLSTVNALTLSPALCVLLLKPKKEIKWNIFAPFDMVLGWSKKIYLFLVGILVRHALLTIVLFAAVCVGTYFMFNKTLSSFIPDEDKGVLFCTVELDAGASLARTQEVVQGISNKISAVDGVKEVLAVSGYSMLGGKGENMGFAVIALKNWDYRTTPETTIGRIMQIVQGLTYAVPEASIRVIQPPAIMGLGTTGGVTF